MATFPPTAGSARPVRSTSIGERDLASWRSTPGRVLARGATRLGARSPHAVTLLVTAILGGLLCLLLTRVSAEATSR